uniref:Ubiquitin-like protease family profile domain-containing protein n=1 Tax=Esox lucius TaxID=8010 RepID=A0A3P8YTS1_ESOLU
NKSLQPQSFQGFPPPPSKGGITVTTEDLECLDNGQFLNDVIIDFYLKYLLLEKAPKSVAERSHVFSSFFYKQLTRRDNASEDSTSISAQQRRHQRVKNWTRHVDIFKKDFLFVPVNQESHWYLVVVCFPGLEEPQCEAWSSPTSLRGTGGETTGEAKAGKEASGSKTLNGINELIPESTSMENQDKLTHLCVRYLQSEWDLRRGSVREFSPEQLKGSHCLVPLQDNSSDCGLYLLQYVESFLQDPVVHFDLPLCLERWFPRQQVRRKRDEIRDLVLHLYRLQRGSVGNIGHMGNVVS